MSSSEDESSSDSSDFDSADGSSREIKILDPAAKLAAARRWQRQQMGLSEEDEEGEEEKAKTVAAEKTSQRKTQHERKNQAQRALVKSVPVRSKAARPANAVPREGSTQSQAKATRAPIYHDTPRGVSRSRDGNSRIVSVDASSKTPASVFGKKKSFGSLNATQTCPDTSTDNGYLNSPASHFPQRKQQQPVRDQPEVEMGSGAQDSGMLSGSLQSTQNRISNDSVEGGRRRRRSEGEESAAPLLGFPALLANTKSQIVRGESKGSDFDFQSGAGVDQKTFSNNNDASKKPRPNTTASQKGKDAGGGGKGSAGSLLGLAALTAKPKTSSVIGGRMRKGSKFRFSAVATDANRDRSQSLNNVPATGQTYPKSQVSGKGTAQSSGIEPHTGSSNPSAFQSVSAAEDKHQAHSPASSKSVPKSSRKRTLNEFGIGELFHPQQIISEAEKERRKRQRCTAVQHKQRVQQDLGDKVVEEEHKLADTDQTMHGVDLDHGDCQNDKFLGELGAILDVPREVRVGKLTFHPQASAFAKAHDAPIAVGEPEHDKCLLGGDDTVRFPVVSPADLFKETGDAAEAMVENRGASETASHDEAGHPTTANEIPLTSSPAPKTLASTVQHFNVTHEDGTDTPLPHPTTARKTISPEMLATLQAAAAAALDNGSNTDPGSPYMATDHINGASYHDEDDGAVSVNVDLPIRRSRRLPLNSLVEGEILYDYRVTRFDFGPHIPEIDAITTVFGPYYTLAEANESAKEESGRSYADMFAAEQLSGRRKNLGGVEGDGDGTEIGRVSDRIGCHTWRCVRLGGRGVVAKVERGESDG